MDAAISLAIQNAKGSGWTRSIFVRGKIDSTNRMNSLRSPVHASTNEARQPHGVSRGGPGPHLALIMVQIMFGTWPIVGKIALRAIPPTALVMFRVVGAAMAFVLVQRLARKSVNLRRVDLVWLAICSGLGVVLNQLLFVKGLSLTTVINATLLGTTIPVFTLLVSAVLGYDNLSWRKVFGIALAAGGVIYLIDPLRADFSRGTSIGNLLIVANSLAYGAYIALSKDLVKRYGALNVIMYMFVIGCMVTAPVGAVALARAPTASLSWQVWLAVLYIVLVPTVGAYYLNAWALGRVEPGTVATYIYLQPLIAFALAPLVLGEAWSVRIIVACLLIFAGVAVVARRGRVIAEVGEHPEALGH